MNLCVCLPAKYCDAKLSAAFFWTDRVAVRVAARCVPARFAASSRKRSARKRKAPTRSCWRSLIKEAPPVDDSVTIQRPELRHGDVPDRRSAARQEFANAARRRSRSCTSANPIATRRFWSPASARRRSIGRRRCRCRRPRSSTSESCPRVPASGPERLAFFQEYLEHEDPLLAQDAYDEFARAPYADVQALKPRMKHDGS